MKLKKGDEVKIVAGKDKGKTGKIENVFSKLGKIIVPGVNEYKRHMKKRQEGQESQIFTITKPLSEVNAQLICPKCHKLTRVGYKIDGKEKTRICRKCKKEI